MNLRGVEVRREWRKIDLLIFDQDNKWVLLIENKVKAKATKKQLLIETQNRTFRSDLYYRLNVLRISLPPLHTHPVDLPALADHLLKRIAQGQPYSLDEEAVQCLLSHQWPGNVRELAHTLERAFLLGNGSITRDLLIPEMEVAHEGHATSGRFNIVVNQTEQKLLHQALEEANGNKSAAARALGMKLSTFRDRLKKHSLGLRTS